MRLLRSNVGSDLQVGPISTVDMQTQNHFLLVCNPLQALRPTHPPAGEGVEEFIYLGSKQSSN